MGTPGIAPRARARARAAWLVWGLYALILAAVVVPSGHRHTITAYRDAAEAWSAKADLYELQTIHGFLYLPQAAAAFVPVTWAPYAVGEVAWRWLGLGMLAAALWALARQLQAGQGGERGRGFLLFTLVILPSTFASARNGQSNLHFAALLLAAGLALRERRWMLASLFLGALVVLKPVAVVPILLAGAVFAPTRWRIALVLLVVALLPFLRPDWDYVARQYSLCWQKMTLAEAPGERGFDDFSGMCWTFGCRLPHAWISGIGVAMALATLGLALRAARIDPKGAAYWLVALAGTYLMLFNPRTEANSYVILAAAALPFVADSFQRRARGEAWALVFLLVALGCDSYGWPIHPWTHLWFKAFMASGFLAYLAWRIAARRPLFLEDKTPVR